MAVHPGNPKRIYAGTGGFHGGWLFYSDNRGDEWKPVPERGHNRFLLNGINSITINPLNSRDIWVATSRRSNLLHSEDHGITWRLVDFIDAGRIVDPIKFNIQTSKLYAMVGEHGLYKTSIQKLNWIKIPMPDSLKVFPVGLEFTGPENRIPILATGHGVLKKSNGNWMPKNENFPNPHVRSMTTPNGKIFYTGITRSTSLNSPGGIYVRKFE